MENSRYTGRNMDDGPAPPTLAASGTAAQWHALRTVIGIAMAVTVDTLHEEPMQDALDAMGPLLEAIYGPKLNPC